MSDRGQAELVTFIQSGQACRCVCKRLPRAGVLRHVQGQGPFSGACRNSWPARPAASPRLCPGQGPCPLAACPWARRRGCRGGGCTDCQGCCGGGQVWLAPALMQSAQDGPSVPRPMPRPARLLPRRRCAHAPLMQPGLWCTHVDTIVLPPQLPVLAPKPLACFRMRSYGLMRELSDGTTRPTTESEVARIQDGRSATPSIQQGRPALAKTPASVMPACQGQVRDSLLWCSGEL